MKTRSWTPRLELATIKNALGRIRRCDEYDRTIALYLDLMERCLVNRIYSELESSHDPALRADGRDWPTAAHTMIGAKRLANVRFCVEDVLRKNVPGDLIETGVWRGGARILMRAILKAYDVSDRTVWVADSFAGLPPPDPARYPRDAGDPHHTFPHLRVSLDAVRENFARYGLLDDQVRFLVGWFRDTLPVAPIASLAVLRLDGDLYESTMDALRSLYPKLSVGGYCIVDDYGALPTCREAINDYRREHHIEETMEKVDWTGVFWRRAR